MSAKAQRKKICNPESSEGVKFVLGILDKAGKRVSEVQSVLFDKAKWAASDAKKWLKQQGFKIPTADETANFFRFRQKSPARYKEMRTIEAGQHRNPESIPESLTGHLALTSDPFFRKQTPEIQAAMMTGMDLAERVQNPYGSKPWEQIGYHLGHTRGGQDRAAIDANLRVSIDPDSIRKQAEWHIDNQLKLQPGYRESYRPHIISAFINGWYDGHGRRKPKMKKSNPAYGQVKGRGWMQESYESASNDARKRASELRKLGYRVAVESMGPQVTPVGTVRMTMVNIAPGKTGDEYLDNVPETKVVRLNPKRNPASEDEAAALSEQFHGRPAEMVTTMIEEVEERTDFTELGDLVELKLSTLSGYDVTLKFSEKGNDVVKLCSSPDGNQLYFLDGDQSVPLAEIHMGAEKWKRDRMILGVLYELTYRTAKGFDHFKLTDYFHKLGEETKQKPMLEYDTLNDHLSVAGGQYHVKDVGIVN